MAFWDNLINMFGLARKPDKGTAYASIYPQYEIQTPQYPTPSPYALAQTGYRTNELVYACIQARSQAIQEAPLGIYRPDPDGDNTPERVKKHPMLELLRKPTPGISQAEFWGIVELTLLVSGFSAWEIEYNNAGDPVALWPMRSDWCSFLRGEGKPIRAIRYQPYGLPPADIDISNVVLFQYFDPLFPLLKGFSPTMAALRVIATDNEATNIVKAMLSNSGMLGGILKTQQVINDVEAQRIRDRWRQQHAGAGNAGDIAVIGSGVEYQATNQSMKDMTFDTLDARSEARICMTYRVPPLYIAAKIGMDRSTYSNYTEAKKSFYENTIVSEWRFLASQMWEQLLPHYEDDINGFYCEFDTTEVKALQEDANSRHDRAIKGYVSGVLTRDESRDIIGLDPIDNKPVFAPGQPEPGGEVEEPEELTAPVPQSNVGEAQLPKPEGEDNNPKLTKQELMAQELEEKRFRQFAKRRIKEGKSGEISSFQWEVLPEAKRVELLAEFGIKSPPVGHEFYGNQWTGGGGGGSTSEKYNRVASLQTGIKIDALPTEGRLGKLAQDKLEKMEKAEIQREENANAFTYLSDQDLNDRHAQMQRNYLRDQNDPELAEKWKTRLDKIRAEEQFRREYYKDIAQLTAIQRSHETGKVIIYDSEIPKLLSNAGDAYHDAGYYPKRGDDPRPELFVRSDLSNKPVRNYITLPDGRIAHPDEIHQSEYRGRLLVEQNVRVPKRDFTVNISGSKSHPVDGAMLAEFGIGRAAGGKIANWAPFHEPGELVFKPTPIASETSIEVKSILEAIRLGVEALR